MEGKRPESRKKHVTGSVSGIRKRGSGLGTGPVGNGSNSNSSNTSNSSNSSSSSGDFHPTNNGSGTDRGAGGGFGTGGGCRSPLLIIILLAVVLLGGGGGLLSGLLGGSGGGLLGGLLGGSGGGSAYPMDALYQYQNAYQNSGYGNSGYGYGGTGSFNQSLDTTVFSGAREKYTRLLGNGQDKVTVMVYLCGTDLESKYGMGTQDLLEMTQANVGNNVHVLVYTGGCAKWNNNVVSSNTNQIYEIVGGNVRCMEPNMGSDSMTNPATLVSFINWCKERYPANRNELILWDHGGGSVNGYGYDEKNVRSGSMSLSGINQALQATGMKFDFIGFDACLMGTVENGLMLSRYADYMIASEETEPGIGWYYTNWLKELERNPSISTPELGKIIVDDFVSACNRECRGQSATLSIIDLAELSATAPDSLKNFSESLSDMISDRQYKTISSARNASREFAQSQVIDQIDLIDFASRVDTNEGKQLAKDLQGAIKYNRTSSNMVGAYGVSIYFPYRKASKVDTAVRTYNAIGMDASYSRAIQEFASLEVSGQVSAGGTGSPLSSLLGGGFSGMGSGASGSSAINSLLGSFLSSDFGSIAGLNSSNSGFLFGRELSQEDAAAYIAENQFDATKLVWTKNSSGQQVLKLSEDQWSLIEGLDLNMFYDDGEGYIDLGLDNVFEFDENNDLLAPTDRTWLAVNGQIVAYYHEYTVDDVTTGYIPVLLNGERAELLVEFRGEDSKGTIVGARDVYLNGETDTVAKSISELTEGDTLDFLCDYYSYDGTYQNSYYLGETMTVTGPLDVSDLKIDDGALRVTYRFTDLYQQHYWTPALMQ